MNIFYTDCAGGVHVNVDAIAYIRQRGPDAVITFMGGGELVFENQDAQGWADDFHKMDEHRWKKRLRDGGVRRGG